MIWPLVKNTTNSVYQAHLQMIDRRPVLMFITESKEKTTSLWPTLGSSYGIDTKHRYGMYYSLFDSQDSIILNSVEFWVIENCSHHNHPSIFLGLFLLMSWFIWWTYSEYIVDMWQYISSIFNLSNLFSSRKGGLENPKYSLFSSPPFLLENRLLN